MCTKEKVTTEQKTLTVFRKGYVRKNDRIRSFFNSFSRRRYAGSLTPIRTWANAFPMSTANLHSSLRDNRMGFFID